jgi:hypothetical protein
MGTVPVDTMKMDLETRGLMEGSYKERVERKLLGLS